MIKLYPGWPCFQDHFTTKKVQRKRTRNLKLVGHRINRHASYQWSRLSSCYCDWWHTLGESCNI